MKYIKTFEGFLNENYLFEAKDPNLTPDQKHISELMEYILMEYEDDYDVLERKIGKNLKKADWTYSDIADNKIDEIKEILKTYYNRKKIITDKFLKSPAKKLQDLIAAMKWLTA